MRVNLFAGPGCGKSLLAAYLYDRLARDGWTVELTREAIKPDAYRKAFSSEWGWNKALFDRQLDRERDWLEAGVAGMHLVTDSPLMLNCFYMADRVPDEAVGCLEHARAWERRHPSVNLFLRRSDRFGYQAAGRYQDKKAAELLDLRVAQFLRNEDIETFEFDAAARDDVVDFLRVRLRDWAAPLSRPEL
jgi:hypothetical protein